MNTDRSDVTFKPIVSSLPAGFGDLRAESRAEGHHFLDRLAEDWAYGAMRFDRAGEAFLAPYSGLAQAG